MSDFLDSFAGHADRDLTMVASKSMARGLDDPKNTFLWGESPRGASPGKVKRLSLFDDVGAKKTLPGNLAEFANLVYLAVPMHLVPLLPAELPASLRTLVVLSGGKPTAALPKHLMLPKLEALIASEVQLTFDASQAPNLRMLAVKAPKPKDLEVVVGLPKLEGLEIGPVPDAKIFKLLAKHPLRKLLLLRGGLTKLHGIEALSKLTDLTVKGMPKLVDVSAIKGLHSLKNLGFDFCPNLGDVSFLAKMKSLKTVGFWGCSDRKKTILKSLPTLLAAKLEVDSEILDDLEDDEDDD